jgi:hypothetical protein
MLSASACTQGRNAHHTILDMGSFSSKQDSSSVVALRLSSSAGDAAAVEGNLDRIAPGSIPGQLTGIAILISHLSIVWRDLVGFKIVLIQHQPQISAG